MPRPRIQFSLRTLLIGVTLFSIPCGYIGWQAKIVRERKAWLAKSRQQQYHGVGAQSPNAKGPPPPPEVSLVRQWLGDEYWEVIWVDYESGPSATAEAERLFPEATVIRLPKLP